MAFSVYKLGEFLVLHCFFTFEKPKIVHPLHNNFRFEQNFFFKYKERICINKQLFASRDEICLRCALQEPFYYLLFL